MRDNSRMMRALPLFGLTLATLALQGCLARAAVDVVTLPVKAVSAGVDAVTTSQSEADEKRGGELREREGILDATKTSEAMLKLIGDLRLELAKFESEYATARNTMAENTPQMRVLQARIQFLRATSMSQPGRAPGSLAEMQAIVAALGRRDPEAAALAATEHVRRARDAALDVLKRGNWET